MLIYIKKMVLNENGYIYFILNVGTKNYKIGVTKNLEKRLAALQTGNENKLEIYKNIYTKNYFQIEKKIHKYFANYRLEGEWFEVTKHDIDRIYLVLTKDPHIKLNKMEIEFMNEIESPKINKKKKKTKKEENGYLYSAYLYIRSIVFRY